MLDLSKTTSPAATPDFEAIKQRQLDGVERYVGVSRFAEGNVHATLTADARTSPNNIP